MFDVGIRNPETAIWNPDSWNPESTVVWNPESTIVWNPKFTVVWDPESIEIQDSWNPESRGRDPESRDWDPESRTLMDSLTCGEKNDLFWRFKTRPQEGGFNYFCFFLPLLCVAYVALALALFLHHLLVPSIIFGRKGRQVEI